MDEIDTSKYECWMMAPWLVYPLAYSERSALMYMNMKCYSLDDPEEALFFFGEPSFDCEIP